MKFNLKGLNLNMLLLVVILVGVLVVILRQNNKCVMDEGVEDMEEGFKRKELSFRTHRGLHIDDNVSGVQRGQWRLKKQFRRCMDDPQCIGVQKKGSKYFDLLVDNGQYIDINNLIPYHTYKDNAATLYSKKDTPPSTQGGLAFQNHPIWGTLYNFFR